MPGKINVLFLIEGNGGGAISHTLTLCDLLNKETFRAMIAFFSDGPSPRQAHEMGLKYFLIPRRFDFDFTLVWRLVQLLRRHQVDILHTHTITGNFYGRWASFLLRRRPILFTTLHSFVIDELKGTTGVSFRDYLRYRRDIWFSPFTDYFIAVSEGLKGRLIEQKIPQEKITVISNGILPLKQSRNSPAPDILRKRYNLHEGEPVIIAIGRHVPLKNYSLYLKAASKVLRKIPGARFFLIGDGPEKQSLRNIADQLRISGRFIFVGWQNDLEPFYQIADILVQCSLTESQGLTVLEALNHEVPVVATDVNDVGKTVINEQTGLLVPSNDPEALAEAVVRLIEDRQLARRIGEAGKKMVQDRFSAERMTEKIARLYQQALAEKGSA